ncbi:MAG TPA: TetR/AcrR family transcriptional regulator [Steroidobacteraceae bacterium]|jgi:AcrR family transcriptional regulator|nr:TetR/AcrR family transcriptional regulator [Steroidobacteraceae bacterium]
MSKRVAAGDWRAIIDGARGRAAGGGRVLKQDRSRQRSEEIIAAALRVFARDGIAGARISDIAAEAGVPPASIYDYFPGKQELAYAVPIVHQTGFFGEFAAQADGFGTSRDRLAHYLWLTADYARRHPVWARVLYLEIWPSVLVKDSRVRHVLDDYARIMMSLIAEGAGRGEWPRQAEPFQAATIFTGAIGQLIITWLLYKRPRDLVGAAAPMVARMLRLLDDEPVPPRRARIRK